MTSHSDIKPALPCETIRDVLRAATQQDHSQIETTLLTGGAIQENWKITSDLGTFVLRRNAAASIDHSHSLENEFKLLAVAHEAGVRVPAPLLFNAGDILGAPFILMSFASGAALGPKIVKDLSLCPDRSLLVTQLATELAQIHSVEVPHPDFDFLSLPSPDPISQEIADLRMAIDKMGVCRPALEWGLRWADQNRPEGSDRVTLTHRDFRTGNFLIDTTGVTAILDWEFAGYGDPMSDLGWFCAECWRFSRPDLEAGGIGSRAEFYKAYEAASGNVVDDARVRFWEIMAHIRWSVIALQQGQRHSSGSERSLELALTGRLADILDAKILNMTGAAHAN